MAFRRTELLTHGAERGCAEAWTRGPTGGPGAAPNGLAIGATLGAALVLSVLPTAILR